jgi:hypothetical protein
MPLLPAMPRIPSPRRIAAWYRARKDDPFSSILPPVPTPRSVATSIRERPGTGKVLVVLVILAVLITGSYVGGPPAWRRVKRWRARQIATEALQLIDQERWNEAALKIRNAFQLSQMQPEAWRANARLLSRTGRGAPAIEWWSRLAQMRPISIQDRRDYASAALSANELGLAAEQLQIVRSGQRTLTPTDLLLVGQLAVLQGKKTEALDDAAKADANPSRSAREHLAANLLILTAAAPDSQPYIDASRRLVEVARGHADEISLEALVVLAKQLAARPPGHPGDRPLSIPLPELSPQNIPAVEIADRLEQHPNSRPYHKMLALEMRARAAPENETRLIKHALQSYGEADDQTAAALGAWLYTRGHFDAILELLPLDRAALNRDLLVERIDALAALGRFSELKEMLSVTEYPVLPSTYQHMYLAVVRDKLGEGLAATNEWQTAFELATTTDGLLALAEYAQKNGRPEIVDRALATAIIKQPGLRSAYVWRLRILENIGPTESAHDLANDMIALWPEDIETRMHEIYLRLLMNSSATEAEKADRQAESLAALIPTDGVARSTIALAKLRQGKASAALEALGVTGNQAPSSNISWPVYVAALSATGWKDKAREQAQKLATAPLLPEERALIAPILATPPPKNNNE